MYLPLGYGEITQNSLSESDSEIISVSVPIQWALNLQRFTYDQGSRASANWIDPAGSTGIDPGGSTVYRASFQHLDTSAWIEVENPWAWHYVRAIYPARCGYRPDDSFYVGTLTPSIYGGALTGCPQVTDWTDSGSPVDNNIVFDPVYDFTTIETVLDNFGYSVSAGRNPLTNLRVVTTIAEASAGCVMDGSTWSSNGATTAEWSLSEIIYTVGESSGLDTTGTVTASAFTAQTFTYTRTPFSDWSWNAAAYRLALSDLGI